MTRSQARTSDAHLLLAARCRSLRDRGKTAATARTVLAIGAAARLQLGGVFVVLDLRAPVGDAAPRPTLGPTGASAEVAW